MYIKQNVSVSEFFSRFLSPMNKFTDVSKSVLGFYKAQYCQKKLKETKSATMNIFRIFFIVFLNHL